MTEHNDISIPAEWIWNQHCRFIMQDPHCSAQPSWFGYIGCDEYEVASRVLTQKEFQSISNSFWSNMFRWNENKTFYQVATDEEYNTTLLQVNKGELGIAFDNAGNIKRFQYSGSGNRKPNHWSFY